MNSIIYLPFLMLAIIEVFRNRFRLIESNMSERTVEVALRGHPCVELNNTGIKK
jgi:hypothetical protein